MTPSPLLRDGINPIKLIMELLWALCLQGLVLAMRRTLPYSLPCRPCPLSGKKWLWSYWAAIAAKSLEPWTPHHLFSLMGRTRASEPLHSFSTISVHPLWPTWKWLCPLHWEGTVIWGWGDVLCPCPSLNVIMMLLQPHDGIWVEPCAEVCQLWLCWDSIHRKGRLFLLTRDGEQQALLQANLWPWVYQMWC